MLLRATAIRGSTALLINRIDSDNINKIDVKASIIALGPTFHQNRPPQPGARPPARALPVRKGRQRQRERGGGGVQARRVLPEASARAGGATAPPGGRVHTPLPKLLSGFHSFRAPVTASGSAFHQNQSSGAHRGRIRMGRGVQIHKRRAGGGGVGWGSRGRGTTPSLLRAKRRSEPPPAWLVSGRIRMRAGGRVGGGEEAVRSPVRVRPSPSGCSVSPRDSPVPQPGLSRPRPWRQARSSLVEYLSG